MRITSHAPMMYLGMTAAGLLTLGFIGTHLYLMLDAGRGSILLYVFVTPFVLIPSAGSSEEPVFDIPVRH